MLNRLVVTADDFGLSREVNEAVEVAHRTGILSAASLMVAEPAAAHAVQLARRLPTLRVGLHLALVEGRPVLPPSDIPDLIDARTGRLPTDRARFGLDITLKPRVRAQVAAEIEAQFDAYARTGLRLDHVNAHQHYHLHPVVAAQVIAIGARYGMEAVRVPVEPASVLRQVEPHRRRGGEALLAAPWAAWLRARVRRRGFLAPDAVLGLDWSGALHEARLAGILSALPRGLTEIYTHPAIGGGFDGAAPGYAYAEELAALTSARVRAALERSGAALGGYADFRP